MPNIPEIFGVPLIVISGILLFIFISFSILTGKGIIKLPHKAHQISAMVIATLIMLHAYLIFIMFYGG